MDRTEQQAHRSFSPLCQIIEVPNFHLFEIELNKGANVAIQDKVVITGEEGPSGRIQKRLKFGDLTPTSGDMLLEILHSYVLENEKQYVDWFNAAGPITIKRHSLEVLPGIGKKIMWDIVNERQKKPFESFSDITTRVPGVKPSELISKRILEEMQSDEEKHYLFVKHAHPPTDERPRPRPPSDRLPSDRPPYPRTPRSSP